MVLTTAVLIGFVVATFRGSVLWLIWPVAAVGVFGLPPITWWQAVCLTWTMHILFSFKAEVKAKGE